MGFYKILLVDDEEEIRRGIVRRIKWEELGFLVVGEAENGVEALDLIDRYSPDLVITDIKMPFMDGIKLAENIHYRFPTTKVIVLSGFDDFEYAREAMKLGVMRYILKPINSVEMHELLRELKEKLDDEIQSKRDIAALRQNYKRSLPVLKERFLNTWIEAYMSEQQIREHIRELEIDIKLGTLGVGVIRLDCFSEKEEEERIIKNESLMRLAVFNVCDEISQKENLGTLFIRRNEIILIVSLNENIKESNRLHRALEQMRIAVQKYLGITVTIGVGNSCVEPSRLYKAYLSAVSALEYTITLGNNKIICIEDIEPESSIEGLPEEDDERVLLTAIKLGQEGDITFTIQSMLDRVDGVCMSLRDYQIYIVGIVASMMKLGRNMGIDMGKVLPQEVNLFGVLSKLRTKEEIRQWLTDTCLRMATVLDSKRIRSKNELIKKALDYIHGYYTDEDLSAEYLCNKLHISTNYFSALFKKEMKMTFSSYLTHVRIERAKELLRTTDQKAIQIGSAVGYPEGHYFSYVFKKTTGVAPTEYRNGKI